MELGCIHTDTDSAVAGATGAAEESDTELAIVEESSGECEEADGDGGVVAGEYSGVVEDSERGIQGEELEERERRRR